MSLPVTNPRGGSGSHDSALLEDGGQLGELLDGGLGLGVLVQRHLHLALLGLEHHGPDLVSEVAGLGGGTPRLLGPDMVLLLMNYNFVHYIGRAERIGPT